MKKLVKSLLCTTLVVSMCACSANTSIDSVKTKASTSEKATSFSDYLDDYVVYVATNDFTTMQQMFENPENYGIDEDEVEVSLGKIATDQDDIDKITQLQTDLHSFDYDSLTDKEKVIYSQLDYEFTLDLNMMDSKFDYSGNLWGSLTGINENLVTYFSEYTVRSEKDIKNLITLINDVPRYINDALDYTKKQAEKGTLCFDFDSVMEAIQDTIDSQSNSSILSELNSEIENLGLDEDTTKDYENQVKEALNESFFPSYQTIKDTLTSLKDKVKEPTSQCNLENGKEYYELLMQEATGSTESIEDIKSNIEEAIESTTEEVQDLYSSNPMLMFESSSITTEYTSVDEILPALEKDIQEDFPTVKNLEYELNALSDDQSTEGVVAYCVTPAIDSTEPTQIRYNQRDYGKDANDVDLFNTLAHEGIPGHMYQFNYIKENMEHPAEYFLDNIGFTEGYATYVQYYVLNYIDSSNADEDAVELYKLNEILTNMYIALMDIEINYDGLTVDEFNDEYSDLFGQDLTDLYTTLADNPTAFLSYYYGYLQIMNLRNKAQQELGSKFTNLGFNTALLQYGNVNFDLIAQSIDKYIEETK